MATINVDIKQLLEAGAHFGHKTSRWHPKMAAYIHSKRAGSHIIDLTKTVEGLEEALAFANKTVASGKQILLVGTKRQAKDIVRKAAEETDMPFVVERWVGGMLTNTATMNGRIKHLKDLETKMASGALEAKYNKLEVQRYQEEIDEMNHQYGGIKNMNKKLGAVFVVDVITEVNAIREARKLGVPVIGVVDTNANPDLIDYVIPANDDAIKTIDLITTYMVKAINAGKAELQKHAPVADKDDAPEDAAKTPAESPAKPVVEAVKI